jgi:hypothetical protein
VSWDNEVLLAILGQKGFFLTADKRETTRFLFVDNAVLSLETG